MWTDCLQAPAVRSCSTWLPEADKDLAVRHGGQLPQPGADQRREYRNPRQMMRAMDFQLFGVASTVTRKPPIYLPKNLRDLIAWHQGSLYLTLLPKQGIFFGQTTAVLSEENCSLQLANSKFALDRVRGCFVRRMQNVGAVFCLVGRSV